MGAHHAENLARHTQGVQQRAIRPVLASVVLVGLGVVSHTNNMDQRFVDLAFARSSNQLSVQFPADGNVASAMMRAPIRTRTRRRTSDGFISFLCANGQ